MADPSNISVLGAYRLYKRMAKLVAISFKKEGHVPRELTSQLFHHANLVLTAYCHPSNRNNDGGPREAIPVEFAHTIAEQVRWILSGKLPDPIADLIQRGAPGIAPQERRDIGIAVAYMKLAEAGEIDDQAPVTNIAKLFGVDPETPRRWKNKNKKYRHVEPTDFFPGVTPEERIHLIEDEIIRAAKRYRSGGRGAQARED